MLWLFRFFGMNHQAVWSGAPPSPSGSFLTLEDGSSYFLLEDGSSKIQLEA